MQRFRDLVSQSLAEGRKPAEIAKALAKGDPARAKKYRRRIRDLTYDPGFMALAVERSKAQALVETITAVPAVGRRAQRGRVDAFKVLGEVSGFHSTKVAHEHSGEVSIVLNMPRPARVENPALDVPDAEVVED